LKTKMCRLGKISFKAGAFIFCQVVLVRLFFIVEGYMVNVFFKSGAIHLLCLLTAATCFELFVILYFWLFNSYISIYILYILQR
jgi:hypothetical protein